MGLSILNRLHNFHFRDVYIVFDINSFETNQNWFYMAWQKWLAKRVSQIFALELDQNVSPPCTFSTN